LRELLAYSEQDDGVLGVFLIGSQSREGFADEQSDYDAGVVVSDDAHEAFDALWPYRRGDPVEVMSSTLVGLRGRGTCQAVEQVPRVGAPGAPAGRARVGCRFVPRAA
jgi:hypothetical protein